MILSHHLCVLPFELILMDFFFFLSEASLCSPQGNEIANDILIAIGLYLAVLDLYVLEGFGPGLAHFLGYIDFSLIQFGMNLLFVSFSFFSPTSEPPNTIISTQ